jgi:hypothetical protein
MILTFSRVDASEASDVTLTVEVSTDLVTWPTVFNIGATTATSSPGVSISENGAAPDSITVEIPIGPAEKKFARLRLSIGG